jgi:hypothetical protein
MSSKDETFKRYNKKLGKCNYIATRWIFPGKKKTEFIDMISCCKVINLHIIHKILSLSAEKCITIPFGSHLHDCSVETNVL